MTQSVSSGLATLHRQLVNQFSVFSEDVLRRQYHPDLSQLGWHLAHVAFIEQYWLREVIQGDDSRTAALHEMYFPELIAKTHRGDLPDIADFDQLGERRERDLIMMLAAWPEIFDNAVEELKPGVLTSYCNILADKFNSFYAAHNVLKAETPGLIGARLVLVKAVKTVLGNCLGVLGIEAPERM